MAIDYAAVYNTLNPVSVIIRKEVKKKIKKSSELSLSSNKNQTLVKLMILSSAKENIFTSEGIMEDEGTLESYLCRKALENFLLDGGRIKVLSTLNKTDQFFKSIKKDFPFQLQYLKCPKMPPSRFLITDNNTFYQKVLDNNTAQVYFNRPDIAKILPQYYTELQSKVA